METNKYKTQRYAKKGDEVIVIKDGGEFTTKGKKYEVLGVSGGWAGQAVLIAADNGKKKYINGLWWDFEN